ncbi:DUF1657 domain-containing protein [Ectobacillus sp. sgz5001026]|jgi:hypothetical protein|uniref:DUF1657 domain-containing protein n=1 Tax=Ectobacillus sp. sgz5001026 TaxID=3242473 RepID=UPI0036D42955
MTIVANVKSCLASVKGAQSSLSVLAQDTVDNHTKQLFHECMMELDDVISDLQKRISHLENEEPQYKGM